MWVNIYRDKSLLFDYVIGNEYVTEEGAKENAMFDTILKIIHIPNINGSIISIINDTFPCQHTNYFSGRIKYK